MASRQLSSTLTRLSRTTPRLYLPSSTTLQPRTSHLQSRALHAPYKDSMERDSLKPRRNEGTVTGSDEEVAHMDSSWNTGHNKPEEEMEDSRGSAGWSMLDESGANQEFSKPQGDNPSENRSGPATKKSKSASVKGKKHGELKPKA